MKDIKESYTAAGTFPIKLLHNQIMRDGKIIPIHAQISPTNRCNLKCKFCSCSDRDKNLEYSKGEIREILDDLNELGTKAITWTGGGEITLWPHLNWAIDYAGGNGMRSGVVSNGVLIDRLNSNPVWLRISSSDDRNPSYKAIEKAIKQNPATDFAFSHVVTKNQNYKIIKELVRFANSHEFTHVRLVGDLLDVENVDFLGLRNELKGIDSKVIYQERKRYNWGDKNCWISLLKPLIYTDRKIYACCGIQYITKNQKRDVIYPMGDVKDLVRIIENQEKFDGSRCEKCYYKDYNSTLELFMKNIHHKEFV